MFTPTAFLSPAGRSSKSNIQGSIRLKVWLSTREDRGLSEEEEKWNEMRQQEKIYSVFMEHQIKETEVRSWLGEKNLSAVNFA